MYVLLTRNIFLAKFCAFFVFVFLSKVHSFCITTYFKLKKRLSKFYLTHASIAIQYIIRRKA